MVSTWAIFWQMWLELEVDCRMESQSLPLWSLRRGGFCPTVLEPEVMSEISWSHEPEVATKPAQLASHTQSHRERRSAFRKPRFLKALHGPFPGQIQVKVKPSDSEASIHYPSLICLTILTYGDPDITSF